MTGSRIDWKSFFFFFFFMCMLWLLAWWPCGTTNSGSRCISESCLLFELISSYWVDCQALVRGHLPCFIVSCSILFDCCLLESCSFSKKKVRENRSQGEGMGRQGLEGMHVTETEKGLCNILFLNYFYMESKCVASQLFSSS